MRSATGSRGASTELLGNTGLAGSGKREGVVGARIVDWTRAGGEAVLVGRLRDFEPEVLAEGGGDCRRSTRQLAFLSLLEGVARNGNSSWWSIDALQQKYQQGLKVG